jgi:serine/threonine protein kinase
MALSEQTGDKSLVPIAEGGQACVYRLLPDNLAIKVFSRESRLIAENEFEVTVLAQTVVPVPRVYQLSEIDGEFHLVMDFIDGTTLLDYVVDHGPLSRGRIDQIMFLLTYNVSLLHHLGICHRDLKPDNILLQESDEGRLRMTVIDFGLSCHSKNPPQLCGGSFNFLNPVDCLDIIEWLDNDRVKAVSIEQARSTDLWALGNICYYLLTGDLLFPGSSLGTILKGVLDYEQIVGISLKKVADPFYLQLISDLLTNPHIQTSARDLLPRLADHARFVRPVLPSRPLVPRRANTSSGGRWGWTSERERDRRDT